MATNRKFHHGISKGISKNDLSPVQFPLLYLRLGSSLSRDAQASLSLDTFFISTRGISRHSRASRETSYLRGLGLFLRPIPVGITLNLWGIWNRCPSFLSWLKLGEQQFYSELLILSQRECPARKLISTTIIQDLGLWLLEHTVCVNGCLSHEGDMIIDHNM